MRPFPIKSIPVKLIDREDMRFSLLPFDIPPGKELLEQISKIGILHPPLIKATASGAFQIVAGRKRLQIINELMKQSSCDCLIIPEEFDALATLELSLRESLLGGPISPLAKATFFKKALALCPMDEAAHRFLPLLKMSPHPYLLQQIVSLTSLEEPLALALHEGRLDEKTALALSNLSFRDRFALFEMVDTLQLSVSNQRKITAICQDLAKRQESSIHALLSLGELKEIIDYQESNLPQKTARVMRFLSEKHAPNLAAAEKKFAETNNRLNLPKGLSLSHTQSFEKDELTLSATFADQAAFDKAWPALATILLPK
ncbi:MAG: ParB N-terminal domain-containing protein [Desulfobulbaceae bacterium]|nr:ParB N-terminal domain-containing protein [Desulfobulbaceae bacterium]